MVNKAQDSLEQAILALVDDIVEIKRRMVFRDEIFDKLEKRVAKLERGEHPPHASANSGGGITHS